MPLENAPAGSPGFSRNVKTEVEAGKPVKQAVAIAYSKARGDEDTPLSEAGNPDNVGIAAPRADAGRDRTAKELISFGEKALKDPSKVTQAKADITHKIARLKEGFGSYTEQKSLSELQSLLSRLQSAKSDAILDSARGLYNSANSRADALAHREAYDRAQALEYQANAARARSEAEATPGYAQMTPGEQTRIYKSLEDKYDGARRRAFSGGRREAMQRQDNTEALTGLANAHLDATDEPAIGSEAREEMPEGVFLQPGERKYPVKKKGDGGWSYNRELLISAAREARAHNHPSIASEADRIRQRVFGN